MFEASNAMVHSTNSWFHCKGRSNLSSISWLKSSPAPGNKRNRKANLETRVWKSSEWNTKTSPLESLLDYTSSTKFLHCSVKKHLCCWEVTAPVGGLTPTRNSADGPEHSNINLRVGVLVTEVEKREVGGAKAKSKFPGFPAGFPAKNRWYMK